MKVFILIILISYILSLYSSNSTTSKQLFNLPLYGSVTYNGNNPSLSILDISGFENDIIYISYYIKRSSFKTSTLKYGFTDIYPDEYFKCVEQTQKSHSSTTSTGKKRNTKGKITSITLNYEIKKQNKKYLVLENLLYEGYDIEVSHNRLSATTWIIIFVVIFCILWIIAAGFALYSICKNKKRTKSENIDFNKEKEKKEEPSPLYPPNQTYDSTQANTIPMQQPPYVPQPIPPEVINSNNTGYSSEMGQQDGYSSGMGEQGYYSGMAVPPS